MNRILLMLVCACASTVRAQTNLVVNPSFEDLDSCSAYYQNQGTIQYSQYWFTPYSQLFPNGGGSVEVFSSCMPDSLFSTPTNIMGYQIPHTGTNYAGLWLSAGFNYREYIEGQLTGPLQEGKRYCVSFWYSFANNYCMIVDGLGLVFTNDSLTYPIDSLGMVIHIPTSVKLDSGTLTLDTTNWILFDKEYIAQGGEQFFTIGNFKTNDETLMAEIGGGPLSYLSYIYLDDVSIILCDSADNVLETPWYETEITLFPNPANDLVEIKCSDKIEEVKVFDAVGRLIYQSNEKIISTTCQLWLKSFCDGVYMVQVKMKNGLVVKKKLIVQHWGFKNEPWYFWFAESSPKSGELWHSNAINIVDIGIRHTELKGKVVYSSTGSPLAGAFVRIVELDRKVETDVNGLYSLKEFTAAGYTVTTEKEGYQIATDENVETQRGLHYGIELRSYQKLI